MRITDQIVVLGASPKPERYANRAQRQLAAAGYTVVPVHPAHETIEGLTVVHRLGEVRGKVHTVTVYVNAGASKQLEADFLSLKPERVIFSPGAENPALAATLQEHGIRTVEACTLVLLATGRFDTV